MAALETAGWWLKIVAWKQPQTFAEALRATFKPGRAVGFKPSGLAMSNLAFHRIRIGGLAFEALISTDEPYLAGRGGILKGAWP